MSDQQSLEGARVPGGSDDGDDPPRRVGVRRSAQALLHDPELLERRSWRDALRVGGGLGLAAGFVPAALLLELAPQLGVLRPALGSFVGAAAVFVLLARARHRALVWIAILVLSAALAVFALAATAVTLTQSISDAIA